MRNKVEFNSISYDAADSIECQGKRSDIQKYLDRGYYIKEDRNGYWVLVKSSQAYVCVKDTKTGNVFEFNVRNEILEWAGKQRLTEKQVYRFAEAAREGEIKFYLDEDGQLFIK